MNLKELYQEIILEHGKNPRNLGKTDDFNKDAKGHNPLCGDNVHVYLKLNGQRIVEDISFEGSGCAISMASASIMTDLIKGKNEHEAELVEYGQELLQKNNSVKLIGNPKNKGGVLSFTIKGIHPHDVATILDEDGVAIRAGHHCCQILHDKLNIPASSRASVGIYNTKDDLDKLNDAINNCKKIFNL
jgi:SUF system NifU family Fe-S assembly protein